MVEVVLRLRVSPANISEIVNLIRPLIGPIEAHPGCVLFRLYSEMDNDEEMLLMQKWRSREELEKFIRSRDFKRVLFAMDLANKPPEISFNTISSEIGMEHIEKLRQTSQAL